MTIRFQLLLWPLAALALVGTWFRFYRVAEVGINGSDVFFYWQMAFDWMRGNYSESEHFRPFIYWLYARIMSLTGPNDWVLKLGNGVADTLVAAAMTWAGWILRRSLLLGLASAVTYLWLPIPLSVARTELVHTWSTLFTLLSVLALMVWTQRQRPGYLFLCGLALSFAWHIHPDLAVLGASVTLVILFKHFRTSGVLAARIQVLSDFFIFLGGYFSVFIVFSLKFGLFELIANLLHNHRTQGSGQQGSLISRLATISWHYSLENTGEILLALFLLSLIPLGLKISRGCFSSQDVVLLSYPTGYLFFCALLFSRYFLPRLFVPLVPVMIIFVYVQAYDLWPRRRHLTLALVVALTLLPNWNTWSIAVHHPVSIYKILDKALRPVLGEDFKLLIAPLSVDHIHTPFSNEVYLDGKALYLASTNERNLGEVIEKHRISHVWITRSVLQDDRIFGENFKFAYEERLWHLFGLRPAEYSKEKEISLLQDFLRGQGAVLVYQSEFGEIYELR
jgi:4-amino-4-deoxy-L-arabinose transferase-like glycosyltransferase